MSSAVRSFVDTNVLVYAFDDADPQKKATAQRILETGRHGTLVLSPQVLQEFYVTVTRKLARPMREEDAADVVRKLARLPMVVVDGDFVVRALEIQRRWRLSVWDALILQAATVGACSQVLSEDLQHGMRIGDVVVVNPFLETPEQTR